MPRYIKTTEYKDLQIQVVLWKEGAMSADPKRPHLLSCHIAGKTFSSVNCSDKEILQHGFIKGIITAAHQEIDSLPLKDEVELFLIDEGFELFEE